MTTEHEAIFVQLPDLIRGGRNPWAGTIRELINDHHRYGDHRDMVDMIERAKAAGLYREDEETGEDNLYEVLPELLATDVKALREFADDPNADYVTCEYDF